MEKGRSQPFLSPPSLNPFPFQPLLGVFSQDLRHGCPSQDVMVSQELSRCDHQHRLPAPTEFHPTPSAPSRSQDAPREA